MDALQLAGVDLSDLLFSAGRPRAVLGEQRNTQATITWPSLDLLGIK